MPSPISQLLKRLQAAADAEALGHDPMAHRRLLDEISNLRDAAETPFDRLMRMRFHYLENLCNRMALEWGLLQSIVAARHRTITASELANQTGVDELLITRTMRLVTLTRVVDEVGPAKYKSNATTELITTPGGIGGEKHHTDLTFAVGAKMIEMSRKGGLHQFPDSKGHTSPFEYTFGKSFFDFFHHDPEQKEAFDNYMAARRSDDAPQWFETYPAAQELHNSLRTDKDAALIVDVGGGIGHELSKFRERFPNMPGRLILEDLPETFETASSALPAGIEVVPHDMFMEQPVAGSKIYYLRAILHDWPDKDCAVILSQIAKAMDPHYSRLIIDEYVLPDMGADRRAAGMDFLMFLFVQGLERTLSQWSTLLDSVNLEIVKVWQSKTGLEHILEAKIKD